MKACACFLSRPFCWVPSGAGSESRLGLPCFQLALPGLCLRMHQHLPPPAAPPAAPAVLLAALALLGVRWRRRRSLGSPSLHPSGGKDSWSDDKELGLDSSLAAQGSSERAVAAAAYSKVPTLDDRCVQAGMARAWFAPGVLQQLWRLACFSFYAHVGGHVCSVGPAMRALLAASGVRQRTAQRCACHHAPLLHPAAMNTPWRGMPTWRPSQCSS